LDSNITLTIIERRTLSYQLKKPYLMVITTIILHNTTKIRIKTSKKELKIPVLKEMQSLLRVLQTSKITEDNLPFKRE